MTESGMRASFFEPPYEFKFRRGGGGKAHFDVAEAAFDERFKKPNLAVPAHRLDQGLIAVAQIDTAPAAAHAEASPRAMRAPRFRGAQSLDIAQRASRRAFRPRRIALASSRLAFPFYSPFGAHHRPIQPECSASTLETPFAGSSCDAGHSRGLRRTKKEPSAIKKTGVQTTKPPPANQAGGGLGCRPNFSVQRTLDLTRPSALLALEAIARYARSDFVVKGDLGIPQRIAHIHLLGRGHERIECRLSTDLEFIDC